MPQVESAAATSRTDTLALIRACIAAHAKQLPDWEVVLFGSRARAQGPRGPTPRSDWDLGVRGAAPVPLSVFFALEQALADLDTLDRVELVDLTRASAAFRAAVAAEPVVVVLERVAE